MSGFFDRSADEAARRLGVGPDPHRDAVDLADEIRAGDFEDRGWMIDALDRAEAMLRAWPDGRR